MYIFRFIIIKKKFPETLEGGMKADVESRKQQSGVPLVGQEKGKKGRVKYCSFLCNLFTINNKEIHFACRRARELKLGGMMEIW